ncbi:MAG TPA: Fe-S cluster assembly protein SufB, partial [Dehalococcoidia bacterium]|nr:Fe-S cluster assembly protein SufB [Dehalococcoidia bacterium]
MTTKPIDIGIEGYKWGFHDDAKYVFRTEKGLSERVVREISAAKNEPSWMTEYRVKAYHHFVERPMPTGFWGGNIQNYHLDFDDIYYFARAADRPGKSWDDVPEYIKRTFDRLGIPEAERKFLAGVGAQYDSEVVYHNIREDLAKQGVIFVDTDTA